MKVINSKIIEGENLELNLYRYCLDLMPKGSLHDTGCGEGDYSFIANEKGFKVTASDARLDRIPKEEFKSKGIVFQHSIIETLGFNQDIVLLSGIFYHLDVSQQVVVLDNIRRSKAKRIILNTHFYNESCNDDFPNRFIPTNKKYFSGAIYIEGSNLINRTMAAMHNYYSFWHDLKSLEELFQSHEMDIVMIDPLLTKNRAFFIAEW